MTSTDVFYAASSTLTVHMPPGSAEAVLMIEALDNVASITLPLDEVTRLISLLRDRVAGPEVGTISYMLSHEV